MRIYTQNMREQALVADIIPSSTTAGPGTRFEVFLQGCNYQCSNCPTPQLIPLTSVRARSMTVAELMDMVRDALPTISGITMSGGEPTLQADVVYSLFLQLKSSPDTRHLSTFIDTNGSATPDTWDLLIPVTDGFIVELKAFSDGLHEDLTGHSNLPVLSSIRYLAEAKKLFATRITTSPGNNDDAHDIASVSSFLNGIDPTMRVEFGVN